MHGKPYETCVMKVQAVHSAFRVLKLVTCLVERELHGLRMDACRIPFAFPPFHKRLDFRFGNVCVRVKIGDPWILKFRPNVAEDRDPVLPGPIVRVGVDHDPNLVLSALGQFCQIQAAER